MKPPPAPTRSRAATLYDHPRSNQGELDPVALIERRHQKEIHDLDAEHAAARTAILQGAAGPAVPAGKALAEAASLKRSQELQRTALAARHQRERSAAAAAAKKTTQSKAR